MTITAEVIAVGDELISGVRLDTNSQWISRRLADLGIDVRFHTTVGDALEDDVAALEQAIGRVDVIIITGGLGPTADDLTRETIAAVMCAPLVRDDEVLEHIRRLFASRSRPMPERNESQAMFPQGSRVIPNPYGTAPGIDATIERADGRQTRIFALPGVPAEMQGMWNDSVVPTLQAEGLAGEQIICHRDIKCFGVGESDLEQMLPDLIRRGRDPKVGITVHRATITLRISTAAASVTAAQIAMEPTLAIIRECLGALVYGEGNDELQDVVLRLLDARRQTLAVCEWGTGGLVAEWLSQAQRPGYYGAAAMLQTTPFRGGLVVQSAETLAHIATGGTGYVPTHVQFTEPELALQLADEVRTAFNTDYGLAISAFPKLNGANETHDAARRTFSIAVVGEDWEQTREHPFAGNPDVILDRSAKQALDLMRLALS